MLVWKKLVGTALLFLLVALVAFGFVPASAQTPVSSATPTATTVNANKVVTATLTPTATTAPVTATKTVAPSATATKTTVPPSATLAPATATKTAVPPSATLTKTVAPSATATKPAATATATKSATATKVPSTATSVPKAVAPRSGTLASLSTAFVVQNTDPSTTASITATFYDPSGTAVSTVNRTIEPYRSTVIDQRAADGGLGSFSSWQGSVVLSSNTQLAAVVNEYSGNVNTLGINFRMDSYNGVRSADASTSVFMPQLVKNHLDPATGTTWNHAIAIQNTSGSTAASVTITYTRASDNATFVRTGISVPPNTSAVVELQNESVLPSTFYGSGVIAATAPVAVIANMGATGAAGVLNVYRGFTAADASSTHYVSQVMRNHLDPASGFVFQTSILVQSADLTDANCMLTYYPRTGGTIQSNYIANPQASMDQRYDAALSNVPTLFGSAVVNCNKPVYAFVALFMNTHPRGLRSTIYRTFFGSGSTQVFVPEVKKNVYDSGTNLTWGTSILGRYMGSSTTPFTVTVTYYRSDGTTVQSQFPNVSASNPQFFFDSRYDTNLPSGFMGSAVITASGPFLVTSHLFGVDYNITAGDPHGSIIGIVP